MNILPLNPPKYYTVVNPLQNTTLIIRHISEEKNPQINTSFCVICHFVRIENEEISKREDYFMTMNFIGVLKSSPELKFISNK